MCRLSAKRGFTLLEISIVLLILSALTMIIYPVAQKRLMVREIDNAVREAQMVADYAENLRKKWLIDTNTDTGVYSHRYETTFRFGAFFNNTDSYTVDELPLGMDEMLPVNNYTGHPYEVVVDNTFAFVRTTIENTDPVLQIRILEQLQNHPLVIDSQNDPLGVVFIVVGRPSPSQIISQVGKAQFDKAFWYQEEIR